MAIGRRPKPLHLHVVEGTLRTTRHRKRVNGEPKPVGDLTKPPAWFSPGQREVWANCLRHAPPGLLKAIDWSTVAAFCVACDIHRQAVVQLNALGPQALTGPNEQLARLLIRIASQQAQMMLRLGGEMGFSPVSRARVTVDPRVAPNEFDEFA
jgi:P27 family predicted phage terminase small subunit